MSAGNRSPSSGSPSPHISVEERDRNRKLLHSLHQEHVDLNTYVHQQVETRVAQLESHMTEVRNSQRQMLDALQNLQQVEQRLHNMKKMEADVQQVAQSMLNVGQKIQQIESTMQGVPTLETDIRQIKQQLQQFQTQEQTMQQYQTLEQKMQHILTLEQQLQARPKVDTRFDQVAFDFYDLKRRLMDKGIFGPERSEPIQEDSPPVGAIELAEDVFTARLLIRLGYMKARSRVNKEGFTAASLKEAVSLKEAESSTGGGSSDESEMYKTFDSVSGIEIPPVEEGGPGYCQVTHGWKAICIVTLVIQILILGVMIKHGVGNQACVDVPLVPFVDTEWWLLHLSKALAITVAGFITGMDIMDIMNYVMTSELIEPKLSYEVVFSACARVLLSLVVLVATVFLFISTTSPTDVWMNMTALSFVSSLGSDMLNVARRGVFGHPISKGITGLSFTLEFLHEYPRWFTHVRKLTQIVVMIVVVSLAVFMFMWDEPVCDEGGGRLVNGTFAAINNINQQQGAHHHHHHR